MAVWQVRQTTRVLRRRYRTVQLALEQSAPPRECVTLSRARALASSCMTVGGTESSPTLRRRSRRQRATGGIDGCRWPSRQGDTRPGTAAADPVVGQSPSMQRTGAAQPATLDESGGRPELESARSPGRRRHPDARGLACVTRQAAAFGPYILRGRPANAACCRAASRHAR